MHKLPRNYLDPIVKKRNKEKAEESKIAPINVLLVVYTIICFSGRILSPIVAYLPPPHQR